MEGDLSFTLTSVIFRFRFRSCLSIPFSASLSFYNSLCSYREQLSQFLTLRFVGFFNLLGHPITCTHKRDRCSSPLFLMRHIHTHTCTCAALLSSLCDTHTCTYTAAPTHTFTCGHTCHHVFPCKHPVYPQRVELSCFVFFLILKFTVKILVVFKVK